MANPQPNGTCQRQASECKQDPEADFQETDIEFFPQVFDFYGYKTGSKSVDRRVN